MKDVDNFLDNIEEAKKISLEFKAQTLQQLILQRYQALTIISSISFATAGIVISIGNDFIQSLILAFISAALFVLIALVSFGRYLYLIRSDIKAISQKIRDLPQEDWRQPFKEREFKADWWPETLYILLIVSVLLFGFSFFT